MMGESRDSRAASCPELDTLLGIGTFTDWNPLELLDHVANCAECRGELERLTQLHDVLSQEIEPRPGFTQQVVAALAKPATASPTASAATDPVQAGTASAPISVGLGWKLLNPGLAALTAFVLIVAAGAPAIQPVPAAMSALLAGATAFLWNLRRPTHQTFSAVGPSNHR